MQKLLERPRRFYLGELQLKPDVIIKRDLERVGELKQAVKRLSRE